MPQRSTRHLFALAVALVGIAVSILMLRVELRLEHDATYTSWCNVTATINCDAVLGSRWGKLLEVPLPVWAIAAFGAGALAAVPGAVLGAVGGAADLVLLALAGASLGFALVLLWIASVLIGVACPLCLTLDGVILIWAVVIAPLATTAHARRVGWSALAGSLVLAVAGGAFWALATPAPATTLAEIRERHPDFVKFWDSLETSTDVEGGARWSKGPASAPVTIVEFSDFQCPACLQAFKDLHEICETRTDVRIVFRHFPLDQSCNPQVQHTIHPEACLAACAAECAGAQGKFWPYHDLLFENQSTLSRDNFFRFARELGLDIASFRTCLDAPATIERVRNDVLDGARLAIASTPTLFVNGKRLEGALERPYYDFAITIEKERAPVS
jgi:uncharacterized membrane protein/predicted DsbA family dithiol-disulfide isomerase